MPKVRKAASKKFSVDTSPTKEAVVESLTRDVTIEACIFDLIDNSIDAARDTIFQGADDDSRQVLPDSYAGYKIELTLSGDGLKILDNCGGIPVERLQTMVLRFGKTSDKEMGIGVFGVGLNRALFKLGRISHLKTDTGTQRSELVLKTEEYLRSDSWYLPAEEFTSSGKAGTEIEIRQAPEDIAQQFADADWNENLRREIGQRYGRFIAKGLSLTIRGVPAKNGEIPLRDGGPYEGEYKVFKTKDGVTIHIEYGQHKNHRFTKEPDYDRKRNDELTDQFGWTLLCNDRAIIIADRSDKTGWDSFHTEFYGFVGHVNFVGVEPGKLPWDTTKVDVDLNNHAYRMALTDMRSFAQKWRKFNEERKKDGLPRPIPPKPPQPTSASTPPLKQKTPAARAASPPKRPVIKPVVKEDHIQSRLVLPNDVDERHCNDKLLRIVHEAKWLDLAEFSYSGLALIRILFETAVVQYMIRLHRYDELKNYAIASRNKKMQKPLTGDEEKKLLPTLDEIVSFLENTPNVWGIAKQNHLKQSLRSFAKYKPTLNAAIHNPFQAIAVTKAFEIRDEALPMLRHIIET